MLEKYDALVLFSGGLDSILSAKLLERQGLKVICLHFFSPFFGSSRKISQWRQQYDLNIDGEDASEPFVAMLAGYPPSGTGKTLNPCVDCKITLLQLAKKLLPRYGARFIATGEVLGQRPMSQRSDTLNAIARDSGCADILLRPLCAKLLVPTSMETSGMVDREALLRISGRGRNDQLDLAKTMAIEPIPTPGGGCRLTEMEAARRYWPLLRRHWEGGGQQSAAELAQDFWLANYGRVVFHAHSGHMLCIGRNERDNAKLMDRKGSKDTIIKLPFPGPIGIARHGESWPEDDLITAAQVVASYAPRARVIGQIPMRLLGSRRQVLEVIPDKKADIWSLPPWTQTHEEIKIARKSKIAGKASSATNEKAPEKS